MNCGLFSTEIYKDYFDKEINKLPVLNRIDEHCEESLKYTLIFPNDKMLMVTKPLSEVEDLRDNEVVFSYFEKGELMLSNIANQYTFFYNFNQALLV